MQAVSLGENVGALGNRGNFLWGEQSADSTRHDQIQSQSASADFIQEGVISTLIGIATWFVLPVCTPRHLSGIC